MASDMKIAEAPEEPLDDFVIEDAYVAWQRREEVRVIEDYAFGDLCEIELSPWPRKGGAGAIINVPNEYLPNDAHLVEIAPRGKSEPERHMYEENVYVLSGHGATRVWLDGYEPDMFEWEEGSFFSIPLNAWYQHFNGSAEPARYVAVTDAPPTMRRMRDDDFIFNNPFQFISRYKAGTDQFNGGKLFNRRVWETSFVANAQDMPLYGWKERGAGGINVMLEMANNAQKAHISEFPVGTYKKGHRHGPGAHLVILSGVGFSLLWTKDDLSDLRKCDWKKGGMVIVPSDQCFHQHFNTGTTRARYLALRPGTAGFLPPHGLGRKIDISIKEGGCQIEYADENSKIHEIFEAELARHGAKCRMKAFVPGCNGEYGPTNERDT
ncbi:MAG: cupin domain-containing protein [Alphaproteobacteria bacterium]|nr:cupin domain-containing protein [Alphaproteobacteria bacterium]